MKAAYIIPEFPGLTHIWMWREISHLREWDADITIFSTRRPSERDRAKHRFVDPAESETIYLWPVPFMTLFTSLLWVVFTRPVRFLRCLWLGLTLPVSTGPAWRKVLPLIFPGVILAKQLHQRGITHLHSQSAKNSTILCMLAQQLVGVRYSLVVNARLDEWGGALQEKFGHAAFVVTHADWLCEQIQQEFTGMDNGRVFCASVGIDTQIWQPLATREPHTRFRIATVGRLHINKGFDVLIKAVGQLIADGHDVELRIIGAGPYEQPLREQIAAEKLEERVILTGSLPEHEVREQLQQADLFALTSREEALGVVFMEAMAVGLPVIGTTVGGIPELIDDGHNGFLVPPDDPATTAEAIKRVLLDADLQTAMRVRAREIAVARFDSRRGARMLGERFGIQTPVDSQAINT